MRNIVMAVCVAMVPCAAFAQGLDQGLDVGRAASEIRGDVMSDPLDVSGSINNGAPNGVELQKHKLGEELAVKLQKAYWGEHMNKVNAARKRKGLPPLTAGSMAVSIPKPRPMMDTPQGQVEIVP